MNYVFINSGLGNQMFQYAFYVGLKTLGLNVKPFLPCVKTGHNGYELSNVFDIRIKQNVWTFLFGLPHTGKHWNVFKRIYKTYPVKQVVFEPEILNNKWNNVFFDGF